MHVACGGTREGSWGGKYFLIVPAENMRFSADRDVNARWTETDRMCYLLIYLHNSKWNMTSGLQGNALAKNAIQTHICAGARAHTHTHKSMPNSWWLSKNTHGETCCTDKDNKQTHYSDNLTQIKIYAQSTCTELNPNNETWEHSTDAEGFCNAFSY